ncbi:iron uptake transporter permease EfeU [Rothia kristinae]|uniref:FTR1 family protein n=1 Tax=Rothia kristinae TaxID=37923 RepID=A0A7T4T3M4_9MICC|nr:iron uptake transporter permease EfeU [Rothia kristinae]KTR38350.1 iron transporter [Rothia kristinae]KTR55231.1 iron transporter [Rothia kristinae]KTR66419.1 iron transporter [Rothia kristinae]KTR69128.1 iron transporter [Rothia kristinae]KTR77571.1 iron transporter [Rothia kristinae]
MFIANLLIALREGFEASLVVGILVAYLVKAGRRDVLPKLWAGIGLAVLLPLGVGALLTWGPKTLTFQAQEIIGGGLSLVAAALVTTMIFWMGRNARAMKHELETSMAGSLAKDAKGWGVVWIAVLAVGREGVETALFIWATVRSSIEQNAFLTTAGVITGLVLAVILGWVVFRSTRRINMHRFFSWTGLFLIFVVAGIVSYGIGDLQEAGVLPGVFHHAWDLSAWLPENSSPLFWLYVLLQAMFQVNLQPTVLQVIGWWLYLVPVLFFFLRQVRGSAPRPAAHPVESVRPVESRRNP